MHIYKTVLLLFLFVSCHENASNSKQKKIPIDKLEERLEYLGGFLAKDIVKTINEEDNLNEFYKNEYLTPLASGMHRNFKNDYNAAQKIFKGICGKVKNPTLFEVLDRKVIKTMRYNLETDKEDIDSIYLQLDININYKLARFNCFVTSKDGKLNNEALFPKIELKY